MIEPSIKSRPVYGRLTPAPGKRHVFVADGDGALAIIDMAKAAPAGFFERANVIYVPSDGAGPGYGEHLHALGPDAFHQGPSIAAILPRVAQTLANARMGTRLYLAGSEGLIGQVMRLALEAGIDHASIETEHRGSLARRVQCVHCKGITEGVTTQPAVCGHCGLTLLVRDHYSRRIAAFQGVCIDAEEPGVIPPTEEIFP
jgi:hypothetical protein